LDPAIIEVDEPPAIRGARSVSEVLQWSGAVVVLIAFGFSQAGRWAASSYRYLVLNLIGGIGLSAAAALSHQWGFALLEGVWGLVAAWGLSNRLRGREVRIPDA
jgi:hypothetical protein